MNKQNRWRAQRLVMGVAAAVIATTGLAACATGSDDGAGTGTSSAGKKGPFKISVSNGYTGNTWRTQFLANIQAKAKEYQKQGLISDFKLVSAGTDVNKQLSQIDQLILDKPDAILIAPTSGAAAETAARKIKAAGIMPLVINDPAPTKSALNIVPDNDAWYEVQTKWLVEQLNGKGNIVKISGLPGNPSDTAREEAAKKILADYPGIKTIAKAPGDWDQGKARQAMSTILSSHRNIDGVLEQDIMGLGVLQAFESANVTLPKAMTGDYTKGFLDKWKSLPDLVTMGVPYTPTDGADAMGFAIRLLQGKKLKDGTLQPNTSDPSITDNTVKLPPALAITRDGKPGEWTSEGMSVISLDEALKRVQGKPDTFAVEAPLTEDQIDAYFQ